MLYYTSNTNVNKIVTSYNVLTIDHSHILASYVFFIISYIGNIPYDTKFWREKILAYLVNYMWFAKIFLSKNFAFD